MTLKVKPRETKDQINNKRIREAKDILKRIGDQELIDTFGPENRYFTTNKNEEIEYNIGFTEVDLLHEYLAIVEIIKLPTEQRNQALDLWKQQSYCPSKALVQVKSMPITSIAEATKAAVASLD